MSLECKRKLGLVLDLRKNSGGIAQS